MKTFKMQAAQGDLFIRRIDKLPAATIRKDSTDGVHILAHSETGHHHVIDADMVEYHRDVENAMVAYLVVQKAIGAAITHMRSFHTHEPIHVEPGIYEIRRQREYTPKGWRKVVD